MRIGCALLLAALVFAVNLPCSAADDARDQPKLPRIAAIVTSYFHNSHADVIVSRLFQTDTLDGKGRAPRLKLVSLYTDQVPDNDVSRALAKQYGFPIYDTIAGALTLGSGELAVDGVLLIAEHGKYPLSDKGQILYPKRRFFEEIAAVIERSGRPVPVFSDKHLGASWAEAKWIYDRARELKVPLLAGSTLPLTWRHPPADVPRGAKLSQLMALNYGPLEAYGYHSLEMMQCLAERREGGAAGVKSVQCTSGKAVWESGQPPPYDPQMLAALLARLKDRPIPLGKKIEELVREPVLFEVEYRDGLKLHILTANDAISQWTAAWQLADGTIGSTVFWTQEARPLYHFARMVEGIEEFMQTGKAPWPVERTLLVSGVLDALMTSKHSGGRRIETPQLDFKYQSDWNWQEPAAPPPGRPLPEQ
jgi:hypothetical protein